MNGKKMHLKNSDLEAEAQGEDTKRATSCCLTGNETRQNIGSLRTFCVSRVELN